MDIKQRIKKIVLSLLVGTSPLSVSAQTSASPANERAVDNMETVHHRRTSAADKNTVNHSLSDRVENHEEYEEYKYIPESKEDFLNMAQRAVEILQNSADKDNEFGNKLCAFYDGIKEKEFDLNDPMVRKTFLAYKKIVKKGGLSLENKEGQYNEQSYLLGIDAESFRQLKQTASPNTRAFCEQIYCGDIFKMLDVKDAPQAEKIAEQLLREKLEAYRVSAQDTSFIYGDFKSAVFINDIDNEWNDWSLQLYIDPKQLDGKDGLYCPLAIVKAHELGHIMQRMPGDKANYGEKLTELAPTIDMIDMMDKVYKTIHNIPLAEEVNYSAASKEINFGKIANTFREIKEKNNLRSYEDVMLTPEAKRAVNMFVTNEAASNAMSTPELSR